MSCARFLDPDWWRKGAGHKEESEMFRELTFRLGFLMQVKRVAHIGKEKVERGGGEGDFCVLRLCVAVLFFYIQQ